MNEITLEMIDNFEIHLGLLIADCACSMLRSFDEYIFDEKEFVEDNLDVIKMFSDKYIGNLFEDLGIKVENFT